MLVVCAVVGGFFLHERMSVPPIQNAAKSAPQPAPLEISTAPSVLFVGDSFTAGAGLGTHDGYSYIVCRTIGWNCDVDAQGATGFISDGRAFRTDSNRAIDRLDEDKEIFSVDAVIIDAGRNDLGYPADRVLPAIAAYIAKVKSLWPTAKLAAIVPSYLSSIPYFTYPQIRDGYTRLAAAEGVTLIDPVAEGWYRGIDISTLTNEASPIHPSLYGARFIAERIVRDLRDTGFLKQVEEQVSNGH
ncbi:SGNH/GDSL hydrolase family protein [Skermania sp. ID1734]|uniref:SGNH/GDSL hydrolase family protein n=1 Tax=Skermania sp. ID1734 TaxID=2597516 RepID=UPI002106C6F9|nr:SGNH/GDSL hydrolase family protein [Skermania sp. ID1734]